jgi:hypothetical protein
MASMKDDCAAWAPIFRRKDVSTFDAIVHMLRMAFEGFFERRTALYTRVDGEKTSGQVIDFIAAALKEMQILNKGKPYRRRAIESALNRLNRLAPLKRRGVERP